MLTNGKIKQTQFKSFADLAREIQRADAERAENLRKTRPMREANARRRAAKDGVVR